MNFLKYILFISLFFTVTYAQTSQFSEEKELFGFVNDDGEWVIEPQYHFAYEFFPTGIAAVVDDSGWVYIDTSGEKILRPFIFDNGPDYFVEGFARYVCNDKIGFFDSTGTIVIKAEYDFARPFSSGVAAVCIGGESVSDGEHSIWEGGVWKFIDTEGNIVKEPQ